MLSSRAKLPLSVKKMRSGMMPGPTTDTRFRIHAEPNVWNEGVKVYMYTINGRGEHSILSRVENGMAEFQTLPEGVAPEHPTMIISNMMWEAIKEWFFPTIEDSDLVKELRAAVDFERARFNGLVDRIMGGFSADQVSRAWEAGKNGESLVVKPGYDGGTSSGITDFGRSVEVDDEPF
jgi:hypothetical protein